MVFRHILYAATLLFFSGCVSVSLGPKGPQKASDAKFEEPSEPFDEISTTAADHAWQNTSNGNTISFLSSCNDPTDPPLEMVAREMTADLRDAKTLRSEYLQFNEREALDMDVEGRVEGVTTRVRTLIFKKNGCLYTLSYVGVGKTFDANRKEFENFMKGFKAP